MKANELRIGNYINTPAGIKRVVSIVSERSEGVYEIRTATKAISGEENLFMEYEVFPIPLTEELLLKCGFESYYDDKYDPNDEYAEGFEYRLDVGIFHRALVCWPFKGWYAYIEQSQTKVEYLHQLQNLYFCLCGEELEVKLD